MRAAIIGLGSMGRRRARNLRALGYTEIVGFDRRHERGIQATEESGVQVQASLGDLWDTNPDVVLISTPPDSHLVFMQEAVKRRIPCFVEASVIRQGLTELDVEARRLGTLIVPSSTLRFFAGPKAIERIVAAGEIGTPVRWTYDSGQHLEDWHPWESIADFYVSTRETGGCREIVPFELTWLIPLFGNVSEVLGASRGKLTSISADIDDYYECSIMHSNGTLGSLRVDVIARPAVRHFMLFGTSGYVCWDGVRNDLTIESSATGTRRVPLDPGSPAAGYINPEEPYQDEIRAFLAAALHGTAPANTLADDIQILDVLSSIEMNARTICR